MSLVNYIMHKASKIKIGKRIHNEADGEWNKVENLDAIR
jgi:hypothetical protein